MFGGEFSTLIRYGDIHAEEGMNLYDGDKNLILHIAVPMNEDTELMASDTNDKFCAQTNTVFTPRNSHYISIHLEANEQAKAKDALLLYRHRVK